MFTFCCHLVILLCLNFSQSAKIKGKNTNFCLRITLPHGFFSPLIWIKCNHAYLLSHLRKKQNKPNHKATTNCDFMYCMFVMTVKSMPSMRASWCEWHSEQWITTRPRRKKSQRKNNINNACQPLANTGTLTQQKIESVSWKMSENSSKHKHHSKRRNK